MRVLLLAGTGEARAIAERLAAMDGVEAIASLAGATQRPEALGLETRVGGFGGVEGLKQWLAAERIDAVIDATHPFAAQMSRHARLAAAALGLARVQVMRPAWEAGPEDQWQQFESFEAAAAALPKGARVFLASGGSSIAAFAARGDCSFVARVIDQSGAREVFENVEYAIGRPPFSVADECASFADMDVLVTKNAGGGMSASKLYAARELGVPVFMITRPPHEPGDVVADVCAAMDWLLKDG